MFDSEQLVLESETLEAAPVEDRETIGGETDDNSCNEDANDCSVVEVLGACEGQQNEQKVPQGLEN